MSLKGLIFDADGTLAETEELHRKAFNQAFAEFRTGWHWSIEEYTRLLSITGGRERIAHYARERPWRARQKNNKLETNNKLDASLVRSLHDCKSAHYQHILKHADLSPRPGIQRLLAEGRQRGLRIALASSSARANVELLLRLCLKMERPGDYFQAILSSDEVPEKKPSPKVYQQALKLLKLPASQCVVVEDSANGHWAARRCGLRTLITVNALTRKQDFQEASLVVDQLGEPENPFRILSGNAHGHNWCTIKLVERLLDGAPGKNDRWLAQEQKRDPRPALNL